MNRFRSLAVVALVASLAGCASIPGAAEGPSVTGSLALAGPTFGELVLAPTACASGEHQVFLGADFGGTDHQIVTRLAIDPLTGPGVRLFDAQAPFVRTLLMRQADCSSFHLSLERTGWQINEIYVLRVTLELDCSLPSGDGIKGSLAAASCW